MMQYITKRLSVSTRTDTYENQMTHRVDVNVYFPPSVSHVTIAEVVREMFAHAPTLQTYLNLSGLHPAPRLGSDTWVTKVGDGFSIAFGAFHVIRLSVESADGSSRAHAVARKLHDIVKMRVEGGSTGLTRIVDASKELALPMPIPMAMC